MFYDGVVVPGAIILLVSGTWFTVQFYGGWDYLKVPWLFGAITLFAFEFIEGNTITRLYFMKLRRITKAALDKGGYHARIRKRESEAHPNLYPLFRSSHVVCDNCFGCAKASFMGGFSV